MFEYSLKKITLRRTLMGGCLFLDFDYENRR